MEQERKVKETLEEPEMSLNIFFEDEPKEEQLEMLLGGQLQEDLQALEPRDVVILPASNDSDSDSDSDSVNTDGTIYTTSNSFSDESLFDYEMAVMSQSVRPSYSFKCQRLIDCRFTSQPRANRNFAIMQGGLHLVARNFNLLAVVSNPDYDDVLGSHQDHQVWCYTPATNRWKLHECLKYCKLVLRHLSAKAFLNTGGNELLIYFADGVYPPIAFVERSIDGTNAIFRAVKGVMPRADYGAAYVSHQHFMYVIGGKLNLIPVCDVHRYDFHKRLWQVLYQSERNNPFDYAKGRFGHQVITDGKFIYCLGGGHINMQLHDFKHILTFNLTTHTWLERHTHPDDRMLAENEGYPRARQAFACVQRHCSNGDIEAIICGGQEAGFFSYLPDIWKLNVCTMKWTHLFTACTPLLTYISSAALMRNDCLFVFGGVEHKRWSPLPRVTGLYKMWLTVPKLSELAWEAYSYYNDLEGRDRQELITLGIPSRFVERLPPVEPSPEDDSDFEF
ncbi:kelch domain-containing protein 10 homolog [Drosophila sulfurigaster albostrigata]|uniref:kelch domain-containing protein 10 homolog n=1 Tax=Drosophila sulfurigaster albostrigata TaxID=89887 RepID=UPI002D21DED5|nr:kelch domain-containing protein 10 homolog [Drosophila sulfurigaster albostrigata]